MAFVFLWLTSLCMIISRFIYIATAESFPLCDWVVFRGDGVLAVSAKAWACCSQTVGAHLWGGSSWPQHSHCHLLRMTQAFWDLGPARASALHHVPSPGVGEKTVRSKLKASPRDCCQEQTGQKVRSAQCCGKPGPPPEELSPPSLSSRPRTAGGKPVLKAF